MALENAKAESNYSSNPVTAAVAFGSNQGDSAAILRGAIASLEAHPDLSVLAQSQWYQTVAIGPPQPDYINGCLLLRSHLSALTLMNLLLHIEAQFGRRRRIHWGPRTLDLDLIFFGDQIMHLPQLTLPHPRLQDRVFVLVPLNELCPQWIHPELHQSPQGLLSNLDLTGIKPWEKFDGERC